ncbi:hypothetical protein CHUAL_003912 [Chamberlinius hualienensis]
MAQEQFDQENPLESLTENERETVNTIEEWLRTADITQKMFEKHFIVNFVSGCKFDVEKTKRKMQRYCKLRTDYFGWLTDFTNEYFLNIINNGIVYCLKNRDHLGHEIVMVDCKKMYGIIDSPVAVLNTMLLMQDSMLKDQKRLNGWVIVLDLKQLPLSIMIKATPRFVYRAIDTILLSSPVRFKGLYIVNMFLAFMPILKVILALVPSKIKQRIHVFGKTSVIFDHVPINSLPNEFGGSGGSIEENVESCREFLLRKITKF